MRRLLACVSVALVFGVAAASAALASNIGLIAPWGASVYDSGTQEISLKYSVSAQRNVPQGFIDAANAAAEDWADWLGSRDFVVSAGTVKVNVPIKIQYGSGPTAGVTKLSFDRQGFIKGATVSIRLSNSPVWGTPDADYVREVTLHELGHAFVGLGHSDDATGLMYPVINGATSIGNCEASGFDALYGWLGSSLPVLPLSNTTPCG